MIKTNIKYFLFLCLIALSCNSSNNDNSDSFIQVNFDSPYTMTHKQFSFTVGGVSVSDLGKDCIAVVWDGHLEKNNYYGFAVEYRPTPFVSSGYFYLILYFPKTGFTSGDTLSPAPVDTDPAPGQYVAVMRYNDKIYKNPQGPITLDVTTLDITTATALGHADSEGNAKIEMAGTITFNSPVSIAVTANPTMILAPY